jgi:dihydrolipoamide dehydrogenase
MANLIDVKVPDIGDFKDVPIIEVLVQPGDRVKTEDPLITLESDKASMDVPSPVDGVVKEVRVKVGDKVSEGSLILVAEAEVEPAGVAPREKVKEGGRSTGEGAPIADYGAASGVYEVIEVRVPDIGDFKDVPIIEIAVKSGDKIEPEDPLITLESDKASMEVPSPAAGTVKDVRVKIGDKVGEGSLILTLETGVTAAAPAAPTTTREAIAAPAVPIPVVARHVGEADIECDMLVLGAGPGGYSAAFRSADLGMSTVLVERYPTLGGVCLNVGCIPSKALLHTASVMDEVKQMAAHGISYTAPQIDLAKLRAHKEKVVGKLTGGLAGMAKARRVTVLEGVGKFLDLHHLEVTPKNGAGRKVVKFDKSIIAAGSQAIKLPFIPDDPRVVDSTGALALQQMPKSMLVIGGGIIGLEMATVYSTLGTRIDVVEMLDGLMTGADRDLVKVWEKRNAGRFDRVMLKTRTVSAEATPDGIKVGFEGEKAPAQPQLYDMVLMAVGRSPNGKRIDADKAGVAVSDRGFIQVDKQMRTTSRAQGH